MVQQASQKRGHQHDARDFVVRQRPQQFLGILHNLRRNDHVGNTCQQWTEDLPNRVHKAQIRFLAAHFPGLERIGLPHPGKTIDGAPMGSLYPFRAAARSRGVNHVSRLIIRLRRGGSAG